MSSPNEREGYPRRDGVRDPARAAPAPNKAIRDRRGGLGDRPHCVRAGHVGRRPIRPTLGVPRCTRQGVRRARPDDDLRLRPGPAPSPPGTGHGRLPRPAPGRLRQGHPGGGRYPPARCPDDCLRRSVVIDPVQRRFRLPAPADDRLPAPRQLDHLLRAGTAASLDQCRRTGVTRSTQRCVRAVGCLDHPLAILTVSPRGRRGVMGGRGQS
jgi:hypothetical protein